MFFCGEENSENLTSADNPSDESGASDEPSPSTEPSPSDESGASEEPSVSAEPTNEPNASDEPSPSTEQSPSDKPVASDEPSPSEQPTPSDKPVDSDEPSPSEQPTPSDKPENSDTTDDSSATDQNDEETESVEIIDIITSSSIYLQFFPTGQPVGDIELPEYVYAQTGPRSFLECDVDWENANEIDTSAAGRQVLRGTLIVPEGISFDGGLEPVVEIPLLIYDENGEGTEVLMPSEITSSTILISDTVVKFPVSSDNAPVVNSNSGTQYKTELTDNIASLEIEKTGTYTADDLTDDENTDKDNGKFPVLYCIFGVLAVAAAAIFALRRLRHGK